MLNKLLVMNVDAISKYLLLLPIVLLVAYAVGALIGPTGYIVPIACALVSCTYNFGGKKRDISDFEAQSLR